MKKLIFPLILVLAMPLTLSCNPIKQAIKDTFTEIPKKKSKEEDRDKGFFEKIGDFIWEKDIKLSIFDIEDDIYEKLGLDGENVDFMLFIREFIREREREIEKYLTLEEAKELKELFVSKNLILNPERVIEELKELEKELGWEEAYVYGGAIYVMKDRISFELYVPTNMNHVDSYSYDVGKDEWSRRSLRNLDTDSPLKNSYLLSELPIESLPKVTEGALDVLKEVGEYNEDLHYANAATFTGIRWINLRKHSKEGFYFDSSLSLERGFVNLKFDKYGNLTERKR